MKATPLVSVIVPVYNIEKYLPTCLDSLANQTYQNFEIILIDDGSTDGTAKVCDLFAELTRKRQSLAKTKSIKDIKIIHQKNAGLSAARNTGIEKSKGELLAFIDGDDFVSPDFLSSLVGALKNTQSDLAVCDFQTFEKTTEIQPKLQDFSAASKTLSGEQAAIGLLVGQENREIMTCNKLYRRKLFKHIKFPVGELHEDSLTTYKFFAIAQKVVYLDQPLYFYRQNRTGSIMNKQTLLARLSQREKAAREAIEYFEKSKNQNLKSAAEVSLLTAKFAYLDNAIAKRIPKTSGAEALDWIKTHKAEYLKNPYLTKKLKLYLTNLNFYKLFRKLKP